MTNHIPPCPVCGTVPSAETYIRHPVVIPACRCITTQMQGPKEWVMVCESVLGRALRTHGIDTIQQLTDRMAVGVACADHGILDLPSLYEFASKRIGVDPRVVYCESLRINTVDDLVERLAPDPRVAVLEAYDITTAEHLAYVLRRADDLEIDDFIAAQRGEVEG